MAKFSSIIVERPDSFICVDGFAQVLGSVKELGFAGVEFNLTGRSDYEVEAIARAAQSINLFVVSFLTGASYLSDGLSLSSPSAEVRRQAVERLRTYTQIAAQFGAVPVFGQLQGFSSDEPDRAVGEARIEECLKTVIESAEKHGSTIAFEPVNHLQAGQAACPRGALQANFAQRSLHAIPRQRVSRRKVTMTTVAAAARRHGSPDTCHGTL
jgi:sugar phosphate isomerase/epimerase